MIHETGYWVSEYAEPHHIHSPSLSNWIIDTLTEYKHHKIYDLGCGPGNYLSDLKQAGFTDLTGVEADPIKKEYGFEMIKANLAEPILFEKKGIIICLEVGEHIPSKYMSTFVDSLYNNCDSYLICSWAVRGQGGHGHVNELDNNEIIPYIESKGFTYLQDASQAARSVPEDYCRYFRNTLMVFSKK